MIDAQALLEVATTSAEAAGSLLAEYADRLKSLEFQTKTSGTDPVSEADRASERLIAERLHRARPDDGFLGEEEEANRRGTTGLRWVVDPLDGTVNFAYGIPAWCVSIACEDERGALLGVVHDPNLQETFTAARGGGGTHRNGERVGVADVGLSEALLATGFDYEPPVRVEQAHRTADLMREVRDIRRAGAAALDLAWTACGRVDGFFELGLRHWDWAAGVLLVEEAGGVASRHPLELAGRRREAVFAGCRRLHDDLVAFFLAG